jgi:hypothetical protein
MKTSFFVTFLAMKKVRDIFLAFDPEASGLVFELKFIVHEFPSVIGMSVGWSRRFGIQVYYPLVIND